MSVPNGSLSEHFFHIFTWTLLIDLRPGIGTSVKVVKLKQNKKTFVPNSSLMKS